MGERAIGSPVLLWFLFMIENHKKIKLAKEIAPMLRACLKHCNLCFRKCGVNRLKGQKGYCLSGDRPVVFRYMTHYGEEPPLSGGNGSGAIFFNGCCMRCVYCQNYKFSASDSGEEMTAENLGNIMLKLQEKQVNNINLVSPTHFIPEIVEALIYAYSQGLNIPIIYNTGGYDSLHVIELLDGLVDIYLPDMRYSFEAMAEKFSETQGYVANNQNIVKEMYRQAGELKTVGEIAKKGLIIRLLILPNNISGTEETLEFIFKEMGSSTYLSVMSQYYPAYNAKLHKELCRRIAREEYDSVINRMNELGFNNGWIQPFDSSFDKSLAGENLEFNV